MCIPRYGVQVVEITAKSNTYLTCAGSILSSIHKMLGWGSSGVAALSLEMEL